LTYSNESAGSLLDVSFEARPGTMTHIVGSSTTDSATLLGLLVGLYPAEGGRLDLDGIPLAEIPIATARSSVVLVLQDPWIMSGTVAENITFGDPTIDQSRLEATSAIAGLDDVVADLPDGLDTVLGIDDRTALTVGNRRLVALARALLRDPAVLLIEDPFRDLTAREETQMIKAINGASRDRTTIVTTQCFDPALFSTDQVLLLENGRLKSVAPNGDRVPLPGPPPHPDPSAPFPAGRPSPVGPGSDDEVDDTAEIEGQAQWAEIRSGSPRRELEAGLDIGHGYRVASMLQRQDLTETWLAWHGASTTIVELKVARDTAAVTEARSELATEFERARRLQHPGIARPVGAYFDQDPPFAVYERVGGHHLSLLIESTNGALRLDVAALGAAVARTLTFIHRLGFAHLDIRPEVVKLTNPGAVITDLQHALPIGTPQKRSFAANERGLFAPEQLREAPAAPAMDVYALGCLLFQAATGVLVTSPSGPDVSDIDAYLSPPVADAVASMLAPDPDRRPSAAEVLGRLRPLVVPLNPRPESGTEGCYEPLSASDEHRSSDLGGMLNPVAMLDPGQSPVPSAQETNGVGSQPIGFFQRPEMREVGKGDEREMGMVGRC
jgi:energy-coupling factor transporter ATP-binding protein EcfA2